MFTKTYFVVVSFFEYRPSENPNLLRSVRECLSYFTHLIPELGEIWYKGSENSAVEYL
jgi:hypothetical protein